MHLLVVSFLVSDDQVKDELPDFSTLGLAMMAHEYKAVGGTFFCAECGEELQPFEVAEAHRMQEFYHPGGGIYRCHNCQKPQD